MDNNDYMFLKNLDWLCEKAITTEQFIKTALYDFIVKEIYTIHIAELNKSSPYDEILSCCAQIYISICRLNDYLKIEHPRPVDHVLVFLISGRIQELLAENKAIANKNRELIAFEISEELSAFSYINTIQISEQGLIFRNSNTTITSEYLINEWCLNRKISHSELAMRCGFTDSELREYRTGQKPVDAKTMLIVAYALQLTSQDFIKGANIIGFDYADSVDQYLIHELDHAETKKKFMGKSNYTSMEYLDFLIHLDERIVM